MSLRLTRQCLLGASCLALLVGACSGSEFSSSADSGTQGGSAGVASAGSGGSGAASGGSGAGSGGSGAASGGSGAGRDAGKDAEGGFGGGGAGEAGFGGDSGSGGDAGAGGEAGFGGDAGSGGNPSGGSSMTGGSSGAGGHAGFGGSAEDGGADACALRTWFPDGDKDGAGRTSGAFESCERPAPEGWAKDGGDCNDDNESVFPLQSGYFGTGYTTGASTLSFDYNCKNGEEPDLSQHGAASNCPGISLTCPLPGFLPTARTGPGVNPICGSTTLRTCTQEGVGCKTVETTVEAKRCR